MQTVLAIQSRLQPSPCSILLQQQQQQQLAGWCAGPAAAATARHVRPLRSRAARSAPIAQALPGFGSSSQEDSSLASQEWLVPEQLLPTGVPRAAAQQASSEDNAASTSSSCPSTVYTLRLRTSWDRGSALTEPMAGVHVCLIGKGGRAVLHCIGPVNDPSDHAKMMQDICGSVGGEVGADCSIMGSLDQQSLPPAYTSPGKAPAIKQRFQEGAVDEVSFLAPELGPLAAIMLAPEGGSWACDEVDVYSSRSNHTDRFVCRTRLGGRKGEPAAYLTPVPPNAVVYGTGGAARVVSKEQAALLQQLSLVDYQTMKLRLLMTTALLTAGGSGVAALAAGPNAAVPFAVGGAAGLLYQWLLQLGADAAVAQAAVAPGHGGAAAAARAGSNGAGGSGGSVASAVSSFSAAAARSRGARVPAVPVAPRLVDDDDGGFAEPLGFQDRVLRLFGSPAFRLLLLTGATVAAVSVLQDGAGAPDAGVDGSRTRLFQLRPVDAWQLGLGICGFMMFKVAVLGVSLSSPSTAAANPLDMQQHLEKNMQ